MTVPFVIRHLGISRFGVLSLAWAMLSYLTLFDFGLGRATTRFVAQALALEERQTIGSIVWPSVAVQSIFGLAGGAILVLAAPSLAAHVFRVPASLVSETTVAFQILGITVPFLIVSASFRGVLEAHQEFVIVNIVRAVSGSLIFLAPVAAVVAQFDLRGVLVLLLASMAATALVYMALCVRIAPALRTKPIIDRLRIRKLVAFGGWVTVSSLVVPILVYADRFLLGAVVSVNALTYYTVPYEVAFRLQVFPASLGTALFPTFSMMSATKATELSGLYARSIKYLLVVMAPVTLVLVLSARPLLTIWLGQDFATNSTVVLQLLSFGMLLNAVAQVPANLLDAAGRPDLRAKVFLAYMPAYVLAAWVLISRFGLLGAALAWTARAGFELLVFFAVVAVVIHLKLDVLVRYGCVRTLAMSLGFSFLTIGLLLAAGGTTPLSLLLSTTIVIMFTIALWLYALDGSERNRVKSLLMSVALQLRLSH
jgi:O-antigen/teichoic acid export membrane protein